jgi:membrane-bound lytic murein transglycosylase MltF
VRMSIHKHFLLLPFLLMVSACDGAQSTGPQGGDQASPDSAQPPPEIEQIAEAPVLGELEDLGIPALSTHWTGDLDGMEQRRIIRVLTVYGLPRYFLDGAQEGGITYEFFKMFEKLINERLGRKQLQVYVVLIPVARDELIPGLVAGRGDIAAAGLTITPERKEVIEFTDPVTRELSEVLVTGPSAPDIRAIEELGGQEVYVRASSSYRASLDALNQQLREQGKPEVVLRDASEYLEDEDLLEMVNSGMLPWVVVDNYKAESWAQVFQDIVVRKDLALREGGRLGYAVRKDSPQLLAVLNEFLADRKEGTLLGNILINRYVRDFDWSKNALAIEDYERFERVIGIFEKYGQQYGLDFLLVAAQGYQESRLDQSRRSKAGAIGIMQMLPSTARDANVGIPDITATENNIHAGIKYLSFVRQRYFEDLASDRFNQTLFALASYNAGPARIRALRAKAEAQGYDPDRWFDNVEVVVAREVGREPVTYVANILKYYTAYSLSVSRQQQRAAERDRVMQDD